MPDLKREKLLNAIIYFAQNTKHCYKIKLMKLLYFLDFWHFKQTGRTVTGLKYYAWERGPVPVKVFNEIEPEKNPEDFKSYFSIDYEKYEDKEGNEKKKLNIRPKVQFNPKVFSKRELKLLEKIVEIFNETPADKIIEASHFHNEPWKKTVDTKGMKAEIEYPLVFDDQPDSINNNILEILMKEEKENQEIIRAL